MHGAIHSETILWRSGSQRLQYRPGPRGVLCKQQRGFGQLGAVALELRDAQCMVGLVARFSDVAYVEQHTSDRKDRHREACQCEYTMPSCPTRQNIER